MRDSCRVCVCVCALYLHTYTSVCSLVGSQMQLGAVEVFEVEEVEEMPVSSAI